jgi:hypothetical protein
MAWARPGSPHNPCFAAVISSTRNHVSAKQKLSLPRPGGRLFLCLFLAFFFICVPLPSRADSLEDSVRALARKVAISDRGASVTIEVENRSGLREKEVSDLRNIFEDELRRRGVKILTLSEAASVILTFSENTSGYLGILRFRRGEASETWIEALGRSQKAYGFQPNAGLTLQRELIFASDQPILDLIFSESDAKQIDVLRPQQIASYQREGDHWTPGTVHKLPRNVPIGRDLRGQIDLGLDDMSAIFPTEICNLSIHDGDHCHPNSGKVALSEVPSAMVEEKGSPLWLTATRTQSEGKTVLLVAGKDGFMRVYGDDLDPIATFSNFGDQVTSIHSDCSGGWQALVTSKEDRSKPDSVQGIEIRDQKPISVTQALQFGGPIIALRRASRSFAHQPSSAIAIVFNSQTGLYEAYRLTVTCAN